MGGMDIFWNHTMFREIAVYVSQKMVPFSGTCRYILEPSPDVRYTEYPYLPHISLGIERVINY